MNLYAVIPSNSRKEELTNLVNSLVTDGVKVIIIDTGYEEDLREWNLGTSSNPVVIIRDTELPKNISRWWNYGLETAEEWERQGRDEEFVVAVLNDDIVIPPGFVQALADGIIRHDVAGAFPDVFGMGRDQVFHQYSHWRMSGYAFAMRGSLMFRADTALTWWTGDNDLELQMIQAGGIVTVGDLKLQHLYPNSTTVGELAEQATQDREMFKKKWGFYCF